MVSFQLTPEQEQTFHREGYLLVPELFDASETQLLREIALADKAMADNATDREDREGAITRLSLRNELGDDIYSAIVRSPRVRDTMERLLGDEVYHYHHKVMLKEPRVGGAWEWHQDYGYWYNFGCLYPTMASCYIAIDRATRENGCLQVIAQSHWMGRVEHGKSGGQTGADMERVQAALERMPLVYVEMEPGTALFFHGNLLHRSDKNTSERPRWSLICCYNTRANSPYKEGRHPAYQRLEPGSDDAVREVGERQLAALTP
ncbi:MAG: phytanoyl-CoA dioxygenase family protein [Planctomycetales bacterium]|nr:phytanoyl-CoA dioxygenase family protein [Planctomycetales bacterium]